MNKLNLDFVDRRNSIPGNILLGVGLAALTLVLAYDRVWLESQAQDLSQNLSDRLSARQVRKSGSGPSADQLRKQWEQASIVSDNLRLPWGPLFSAIGKTAEKESVAVLSIEPEMQKKRVLLVAEAKNMAGLVAAYKSLQASPEFSRVELQSHSITQTTPEKPVRFKLLLEWRVKK